MSVDQQACEFTRQAKELYNLISENQDNQVLYRLANIILEKMGPAPAPPKPEYSDPKQPKPMNDIAARGFENTEMPFGQYAGAKVGNIPLEYLNNLASDSDFIKDLRRYVKSKHFKRKVKDNDTSDNQDSSGEE